MSPIKDDWFKFDDTVMENAGNIVSNTDVLKINQSMDVRVPKNDANDFTYAIRVSSIRKVYKACNDVRKASFSLAELWLSLSTLITNYHVLKDAERGFLELHLADKDKPSDKSIKIQFDRTIVNNKLGELDLVALPIAATLNELFCKNIVPFYRTVSADMIPNDNQMNELAAIEDITFIGYPNGLYDDINKMSIVRQGITATPIWNDFKGQEVLSVRFYFIPGFSPL